MRNQNIAKVLKEYRKRNHLSVNDVSILLEDRSFTAAPKTIYGWESGQANPSAYHAKVLYLPTILLQKKFHIQSSILPERILQQLLNLP